MDALLKRVRDFVAEQVVPREDVLSAGGEQALAELARLRGRARREGLWALPLPASLGGAGLSLAEYAPIAEAEGFSEYGPAALGSDLLLDALMLQRHACATVREKYLAPMVAGQALPCFALTEPGRPGSDPKLVATQAIRDADGWMVNGAKWFISRAASATFVTVACRTVEGVSLIVVPARSPGFRIVRALPLLGGADDQYEIAFDGVRVPPDHLLGEPGQGLSIVAERLALGRTLRCLRWLGQIQRTLDLLCARMVSRQVRGGTLADKQLLHRMVFDSHADLASARALTYAAVDTLEGGGDTRVPVGTAKVVTARAFDAVVDRAIQIHGAEGLTDDTVLPMLHRTARAARILDGPDEVHVTTVARAILAGYQGTPGTRPVDAASMAVA